MRSLQQAVCILVMDATLHYARSGKAPPYTTGFQRVSTGLNGRTVLNGVQWLSTEPVSQWRLNKALNRVSAVLNRDELY